MGRVEVLQHVEAFAEVGLDRRLDDRAVRSRHQSTHAGQLANLRSGATRAGVGHDEQRVHRLLADFLALGGLHLVDADHVHHGLGHEFVGARPDVDNLVVALAGGDQTGLELLLDLDNFLFRQFEDALLGLRNLHVVDADRDTGACRVMEARVHELVGKHDRFLQAEQTVAGIDQARDVLLREIRVGQGKRQARRQDVAEQGATDRGLHDRTAFAALAGHVVDVDRLQAHANLGVQIDLATVVGAVDLIDIGEHHAFAACILQRAGQVIEAENDVLRRHDDRITVGRREDVVRRHHQRTRFELGFQ